MTGKVFVDLGMSLDGFVAGPTGGPRNPLGDGGTRVHECVYGLRSWRERLGMEGGETGSDDELIREVFARGGAYVMGRRMFDEGELAWPDPPPSRVHVSAVLLGAGLPLFDGSRTVPVELERVRVMDSPGVTHLAYRLPRSSG